MMGWTRHTGKRNGFTLIELLTVLMVLSVVSTLGVSAYFQLSRYWNVTVRGVDMQVTADRIFSRIDSDVNAVVSASLSGHAIWGEERLEETHRYNLVQLEHDRVVLPVEYISPVDGRLVRASVMYHIERGGIAPVLKRSMGTLGERPPAGAQEVIAEGVLSLRVQYRDGNEIVSHWDAARHPDALIVSVVLQDPNRLNEQVARRSVFPVQVR